MYGRESAGHRLTSAMYQPADTTIVAAPTSSLPIRFHIPTGAATRNASARPGTTRNACNIFVRNAKPMAQPANAIQRVLAVSVARTMQYAAATSSRTSNASGLLNRNISAATGVSASTAPAIRPAAGSAGAPHGRIQQCDGGDAHQRLRQQHRERVEAEQPAGQAHHPQRRGWLVDRDRVAGVQRSEQPRLPVLRAGLRRGRVVVVGPAGGTEPPQIQHGGRGEQCQHRGAHPARLRVSSWRIVWLPSEYSDARLVHRR